MNENEKTLKLISKILLRSFMVAVVILVIWFVAYLTLGHWFIPLQARVFGLAEAEVRLLNFGGVTVFRALAVCVLLCPLIAIEWLRRSQKES